LDKVVPRDTVGEGGDAAEAEEVVRPIVWGGVVDIEPQLGRGGAGGGGGEGGEGEGEEDLLSVAVGVF